MTAINATEYLGLLLSDWLPIYDVDWVVLFLGYLSVLV